MTVALLLFSLSLLDDIIPDTIVLYDGGVIFLYK